MLKIKKSLQKLVLKHRFVGNNKLSTEIITEVKKYVQMHAWNSNAQITTHVKGECIDTLGFLSVR